jgi:uncharacterized protein (TIGR02145 family)
MSTDIFTFFRRFYNMRFLAHVTILVLLIILPASCKKEAEKPPEPVSDIEGNTYLTVRIGTQIWMAENLKTITFNDGTEIPPVIDSAVWKSLSTPGYCWYNNFDTIYKHPYGVIYNGYTATTGKLCPTGWHVPDNNEWNKLSEFLADSITGGGKLKATGTIFWKSPNKGATNSSGFSALPSGFRYYNGSFSARQYYTAFWSTSESGTSDQWFLSLYYGDAKIIMNQISKKQGFSVRCVKD